MARESGPPVIYLFGVLPANFENVEVSVTSTYSTRILERSGGPLTRAEPGTQALISVRRDPATVLTGAHHQPA